MCIRDRLYTGCVEDYFDVGALLECMPLFAALQCNDLLRAVITSVVPRLRQEHFGRLLLASEAVGAPRNARLAESARALLHSTMTSVSIRNNIFRLWCAPDWRQKNLCVK